MATPDSANPEPPLNWADDKVESDLTEAEKEAAKVEKEKALADRFKTLSMSVQDLQTGEVFVKFSSSTEYISSNDDQVEKVKAKNFTELPISPLLKEAVTEKGWDTMSLIQQVGIPLIIKSPPCNFIGQAQAGTGKTGTFVLSSLARMIGVDYKPEESPQKISEPTVIILATTQELVTQIASEVNSLGKFAKIRARRIMSSRGKDGKQLDAPWALRTGEDFAEKVVVGTVGMVKNLLRNSGGRRPRKPCIKASSVKVLILDEADQLLLFPPYGFGQDVLDIRNTILAKSPGCQLLCFSATFSNEAKRLAAEFVGPTFNEVTLKRKDMTLDKVVNMFVLVQPPKDDLPPQIFEDEVYKRKFDALVDIWTSLSTFSLGQTVVFVNRKSRAQALGVFLEAEGINVGMIHGDMPKDERERVFAEFKAGKRTVLVATNILSRGIDNPNVTLVVNIDLPQKIVPRHRGKDREEPVPDPETFVHRIGRSGRWTKKGASVSLVCNTPRLPDIAILQEIERQLFTNESVQRPLIQVSHPSQLGDAIAHHLGNIS